MKIEVGKYYSIFINEEWVLKVVKIENNDIFYICINHPEKQYIDRTRYEFARWLSPEYKAKILTEEEVLQWKMEQ
jgi:sRNA-binding carbon storage regulator CsrA